MIRILFIDDSIERLQELTQLLNDNDIEHQSDYVNTKEDALKKLSSVQYDLVLIDIMLPDNMKIKGISEKAGIDIVTAIELDKTIIKPLYMMGITSSKETYEKSCEVFDKSLIPLNVWNDDSEWKNTFLSKIKYLNKLSVSYTPINKNKVDIALITAVQDEYAALNSLPVDWEPVRIKDDPCEYAIGTIIDDAGNSIKIIKSRLLEMGMSSASYSTTKIINIFNPEIVIMVGICGGRKDEVQQGDIIVADKSWDYGSGKITYTEEGNIDFSALPNQISIDSCLKANIQRNSDLVNGLFEKWNADNDERKISKVHIGAMPSGSAVIAAKDFIDKIVLPQYRKFLGIDMETYGVYFACQNAKRSIKYVSIKSVSDLADKNKNDDYHKYGSYISASFAFELIKRGLLFD